MKIIKYVVKTGEYPFDVVLGFVDGPEEQPEVALDRAIKTFGHIDAHPVIEPAQPTH